jgi:hypothetical protein
MVHPNSLANLKPFSELTEDQRRKICKKGGQASVEAKRARKTSKEIVEMIATMPIADSKILSKLEKEGFKKKDTNYLTAFWFSLYARVISKADVPAAKLILEVLGEMPDQEDE